MESLKVWKDWTIDMFDNHGAHIKEQHFLNENEISEKLKEKKSVGVFFDMKATEKAIHSALKNPTINQRVECWSKSPEYKNQRRLILSYPTEEKIGYTYQVHGKNTIYSECDYICLVFLKNPAENSFFLYSAYPDMEQKCITL